MDQPSSHTPPASLDDKYWTERWIKGETGWDTGAVTTPMARYIDQLERKDLRILIPGCGNAWEARYLLDQGFTDVTLLDISEALVKHLRWQFRDTPLKILHTDFFAHQGSYDLILEQTFFCALDPSLRKAYVKHMHELLVPGGRLAGVLFDCAFEGGPPFGGSRAEYEALLSPWFQLHTLAPCYNSIAPRMGREVFLIAAKTDEPATTPATTHS